MQTAETVMNVIRVRGTRGLPLENIYRLLYNRNLYLEAYSRIYRNKGAMTKGITEETVDGMSVEKIDQIIEELRMERFRWTPVRRVEIPKENGRKRPLGIPTTTDKLVQEVIRLILNAYYEPQFSDRSHGFRPRRGCHTALNNVTRSWTGVSWIIEGDIKGCFDNIDHEVLLSILSEKIKDNRFLNLLKYLLKAGYMEDWKYNTTLSGTPQGGIVSPLLSNIYLDRLDKYVEEVLIPANTRGTDRKQNRAYTRIRNNVQRSRKKGDFKRVIELKKQMRQIPSRDNLDPEYRRLRYVRYADDFILGLIGSKAEAEKVKEELEIFLRERLNLELSREKTLITNARKELARFLGYEIENQQANDQIKAGRRMVNGRIGLRIPQDVIEKQCQKYMKKGKPQFRSNLLHDDDLSIVGTYGAEYRGVVNYYLLAYNVHHLGKLHKTMEMSLARTLAAKHKTTAKRMRMKYKTTIETEHGPRVAHRVVRKRKGKKPLIAIFGGVPLKRNKKAELKDQKPSVIKIGNSELLQKMLAEECSICGSRKKIEVHHIRGLKDLKTKGGREKPEWNKMMAKRKRKFLVVCRECHMKIHNGENPRTQD